jgi:hypothetical protein
MGLSSAHLPFVMVNTTIMAEHLEWFYLQ